MNRFERVFKETKQENDLNKVTKPVQATTVFRPPEVLDYEKDPRPDLEADHVLWVALLTTARERGELFGILHCLRYSGAHLRDKDFGMLIRPGEWDQAEYEAFRAKHLAPRKAEVVAVLKTAAKRLPEVQRDTLKSRMANKVKFAEPRAMALGWTKQDLWAEKEWTDFDGRRRESLYMALVTASQAWGHAELGEVTREYAEIVIPRPGGHGTDTLKVYRLLPWHALVADPAESQPSATTKKAEVSA